jgi:lon-related putative ATP-dependent protease
MTIALTAEDLRRSLDPADVPFDSTAEVEPLDGLMSQPRAGEALELALGIDAPGYNLFATGPAGTGKRSVLEAELRRRATARPAPRDWVYLHDFAATTRPAAVALPAGRGPDLARDVAALVEESRRGITEAFESDRYRERHRLVHDRVERGRREVVERLQEVGRQHDVELELTPAGVVSMPLVNGSPIAPEAFLQLPPKRQAAYQQAVADLESDVRRAFAQLRALEREGHVELAQLDHEVALFAIGHLVDEMKRRWSAAERLCPWLDALREDLIEHVDLLRADGSEPSGPTGIAQLVAGGRPARDFVDRYEINVLVTHEAGAAVPVVAVYDCSYYELFGRIEYETVYGAAVTDHRHVRPGAVHRAAGGYLVLHAPDVLSKPFLWGRLKELLRTGKARIENLGAQYMLFPSASLEPEPIDVELTVVLVGSTELYRLLHALDPDVPRLFKVRADFDSHTPWDQLTVRSYAAFVSQQVRDHRLPHFDRSAIARLVEHGARLAEDRERLSTRLPDIGDIVLESAHRASQDDAALVTVAHVDRSLRDRRRRSDLPEQWIRQRTIEGDLRIDVTEDVTGQVNGLAVISLGDCAFGHPVRITATVAAGEGKVVDIDREAELSGPLHDKGVLILAGLLRHLYCRDTALALRASLVFEQSYGPVEGDSASGAELFALLSALADTPVHQRVGVTGSVDQHGHIQAIGGVNEKIEGFFAVCREHGLNGDQGVIIPAANLRHLMVDHEVVEAVRQGRFHVWAVDTIDDAIELLTGTIAGAPDADGTYPEHSFHGRAQARIASLAELAREFHRPAGASAD